MALAYHSSRPKIYVADSARVETRGGGAEGVVAGARLKSATAAPVKGGGLFTPPRMETLRKAEFSRSLSLAKALSLSQSPPPCLAKR